MKVSIIIPNWNGQKLLAKNLPHVIHTKKYKKNNIREIIIVDDGSTDDSVKFLNKNFKSDIQLVKHTKNRGFSSAVNTGARTAKGQLLCLLNTDVIPNKNFLQTVIPIFSDKDVFAVGLHEEGYGPPAVMFKNGYIHHINSSEPNKISESFWVSGGSGVFRRDIWMQLRGLDEILLTPFYREDIDICYRAAKRGYKNLWAPKALVKHKHESIINTDNFDKKYMDIIKERNELLIHWKNITSPNFFRKHISGVLSRTIKHPGYSKVVFEALKKLKKTMNARSREKKESTVSDEAIFAKFSV
jgi:GT2 family glycosyltransferase